MSGETNEQSIGSNGESMWKTIRVETGGALVDSIGATRPPAVLEDGGPVVVN
jgi:hypothetical protein